MGHSQGVNDKNKDVQVMKLTCLTTGKIRKVIWWKQIGLDCYCMIKLSPNPDGI